MRLLLIDDDQQIIDILYRLLRKNRFLLKTAKTINAAEKILLKENFDLIILDRSFPKDKRDGLELCRKLRRQKKGIPILMLSARKGSSERTLALRSGADDYLEKPYDPEELLARIQALLKQRKVKSAYLDFGSFRIDREKGDILLRRKPLSLRVKESQLLDYFLRNSNRLITEREILKHIWHDEEPITRSNTVNVHLMRLRRTLGDENKRLRTVRGRGFIFNLPENE